MCIRVSERLVSGMLRPDTHSSSRLAASLKIRRVYRWLMAALIKIFACQHLLLGGIRRRLPLAPEAAHSAGRVTIPDCATSGHLRSALSIIRPGSARKDARVYSLKKS